MRNGTKLAQKMVYIKPGRSSSSWVRRIFLPGKMGRRIVVFRNTVTKVITLMSKKSIFEKYLVQAVNILVTASNFSVHLFCHWQQKSSHCFSVTKIFIYFVR